MYNNIMVIIALLIALIIPLLSWYIIYRLDFFKTGDKKFIAISFLAGIAAYFAAYQLNTAVLHSGLLSRDMIIRFAAPGIEEVLKAIVIIILVQLPRFTYFVDGAIYGFAAGMGFAIAENYQYIFGDIDKAMGMALARVLSTNLVHASASATAGIILGLSRYRKTGGKIGISLGGLGLAFLLHCIFNNMVQMQSNLRLIFAIIVGFAAAGAITYFIKRGLKDEQNMIRKKLGDPDRVTRHEAAAVQDLSKKEKLQALKIELKETYGEKCADKVIGFLLIQARLGILRDSLERIPDERMRQAIQQQMDGMRMEMEKARREVGPYAMMHVRNTFVEQDQSISGQLRAILDERLSNPQPSSGFNVHSTMQQRLQHNLPEESKPAPTGGIWGTLQQRSTKSETKPDDKQK